jgi:hypothetical protein
MKVPQFGEHDATRCRKLLSVTHSGRVTATWKLLVENLSRDRLSMSTLNHAALWFCLKSCTLAALRATTRTVF